MRRRSLLRRCTPSFLSCWMKQAKWVSISASKGREYFKVFVLPLRSFLASSKTMQLGWDFISECDGESHYKAVGGRSISFAEAARFITLPEGGAAHWPSAAFLIRRIEVFDCVEVMQSADAPIEIQYSKISIRLNKASPKLCWKEGNFSWIVLSSSGERSWRKQDGIEPELMVIEQKLTKA